MFRLKSLLFVIVAGFLWSGQIYAESCPAGDCRENYAFGGEDDVWPWVVVDLWENIEGVWMTENVSSPEFYRFEIKQRYSDGALAVKIDVLVDADQNRVSDSYMSWGDVRNRDLRTVVKMFGKSHFLRVKAYDRSRLQCFESDCGGLSRESIVLGMVMTPRYGNPNAKHLRLLRKIAELKK